MMPSNFVSRPARLATLLRLFCAAAAGVALAGPTLAADSAATQLAGWAQAARASDPAFTPSEARGRAFFARRNSHSADMPSCAACHTEAVGTAGRHVVTGKTIAPMAPQVNAQRFADAAKSEKWFKRNCNDVLGRECSAAEKADVVAYLASVR